MRINAQWNIMLVRLQYHNQTNKVGCIWKDLNKRNFLILLNYQVNYILVISIEDTCLAVLIMSYICPYVQCAKAVVKSSSVLAKINPKFEQIGDLPYWISDYYTRPVWGHTWSTVCRNAEWLKWWMCRIGFWLTMPNGGELEYQNLNIARLFIHLYMWWSKMLITYTCNSI